VFRLSSEKPPDSCRVPSSECRAGLDPLRLGTFEVDPDWRFEGVSEPKKNDVFSRWEWSKWDSLYCDPFAGTCKRELFWDVLGGFDISQRIVGDVVVVVVIVGVVIR